MTTQQQQQQQQFNNNQTNSQPLFAANYNYDLGYQVAMMRADLHRMQSNLLLVARDRCNDLDDQAIALRKQRISDQTAMMIKPINDMFATPFHPQRL
jgi:hypothetical protein